MASEAVEAQNRHSPGWRLAAMLAVMLVMLLSFIGGSIIAGGWPPTGHQAGLWTLWFGFQAVCLLLGFSWNWIRRLLQRPGRRLSRQWSRWRARLRRRLIGDRSRDEYSRAEAGMIWPLMALASLGICFISLDTALTMLIAAVTLFMVFAVVPYYRDAPNSPVGSLIFAALFSFGLGYTMTMR